MLDNQTRRELLSKARQSGFPGSILDVFTAYEQGKDLIGEFQQQQQQQQSQQMSDMAAQQSGMMAPGQQPLPQEMPQAPAGPPPGLQGQSLPGPQPPANPNLVDSTQQQPVGMATNAKGSSGGQVIMATGGFVEKFTDDQYNKFSTHFPFSKEQRGSIAHNATVEHPDLTMVNPKKYVFGGLKYKAGGMKTDPPDMPFGLPLKEQNIYTLPEYNQPKNPKTGEILPDPRRPNLGMGTGANEYKMTYGVDEGDVDVPSIVAGQYIGDQAYDRYNLTGERFKTMTDPGSYSKFYEQIGRLGLMQEKRKGGFEGDPLKNGDPLKQAQIATAADSSFVADRANSVNNFYIRQGYELSNSRPVAGRDIFAEMEKERESYKKRLSLPENDRNMHPRNTDAGPGRVVPYNKYTTYKKGEHKFGQRELSTGVLNMNAPMSQYDDRIMPQYMNNYFKGDIANVPVYDKLAVTPWGKLTESQKLKRLQKFGGDGTPFEGQTSEEALESFKNPKLKMKEAGLLPVPKIDLQPQLPTLLNPYPPKPETEYFIMPSGNPGVGVIHGRTYDGKGGYKEKVIGPSLARDWFNDADQKAFDTRDMSSRVDYDPRDKDPDHKIYADMYSAVKEIDNLTQQQKEAKKPKKAPQVKIIKAPKFATGGYKVIKKRR